MALHCALLPLVVLAGPMAPNQGPDRGGDEAAESAKVTDDPEDKAEEGRRQERRVLLTTPRLTERTDNDGDPAPRISHRLGGGLGLIVESTVAAAAVTAGASIFLPAIYLNLAAHIAVGFTAAYGAAPQLLGPSTIAPLTPTGILAIAALSSVALFGVGGGTTLVAATAAGLASYLGSTVQGRATRSATERAFLEAAFVGAVVATALTGAVVAASAAGVMLALRRPSVGVPQMEINVGATAGVITVAGAAAVAGAVGPAVSRAVLDEDEPVAELVAGE